ncbi:MAG: hypothetical protein JSW41_03895 [Candidatus Aenigmatarchaeota archaeon]|nr:MAG: hypothetical protein JSW41_03895 [Candidatus Aenigmarchaeota archaeon]
MENKGSNSGYVQVKPRYMVLTFHIDTLAGPSSQYTVLEFLRKVRLLSCVGWAKFQGATVNQFGITVYNDLLMGNVIFNATTGSTGAGWFRAVDKTPTPGLQDLAEDDYIVVQCINNDVVDLNDIGVSILARVMD